ncbi:Glycosyl transferases group 1 [compost metagenome]
MKKVGMFLGFQPGDNLSIHGIGRLLAFILKENHLQDNDNIILFCPEWLRDSLKALLKDNKIPLNKFEIVSTEKIPLGVIVRNFIKKRKKERKKVSKREKFIRNIKDRAARFIHKVSTELFSTSSWGILSIKLIAYLVVLVVISPLIFLLGILYLVFRIVKLLKLSINKIIRVTSISKKVTKAFTKGKDKIYLAVIDNELNKLVRLINKRKDVNVCYIPSMVWPQIKDLKCAKVVAAPDIVFYDFPTQFQGVDSIHRKIRKSVAVADHLICYSDYVKDHHLIKQCGVKSSRITVIKHANIDMSQNIKVSKSIARYLNEIQNAKQVVKKYIRTYYNPGHVLYFSDLEKIDYVVYSSQYRPHKNIFNLIKAIKIVNRDFMSTIKLLITADIENVQHIKQYIKDNHLENEIIVMHSISSELLAAINTLATCAVNPTLFEGGFPFTFSEAYSVGTPSIISDIPAVNCEIEDSNLKENMLFDPYNPYSIAEKIVWAVDNAEMLYNDQNVLYQKFGQRDWRKVVNEYNDVFNKFLL